MLARPRRRPASRRGTRRGLAAVLTLGLVLAACADDDGTDQATAAGDEEAGLSVAIASFDLATGSERRLLAGLYTADAELLSFGDVEFQLGHLGDDAGGATELTEHVTASFLPVPGWEPDGDSERPTLGASDGRGVYAAEVDLDDAGYWGLRVVAELEDGEVLEGQTVFSVADETQIPDVGDDAPTVANHTIEDVEDGTVEPVALDSRAQDGAEVPDVHLHETSIPDALEAGIPTVVIVSTPVYCRTNFCGPLVETLAEDAQTYADRAAFVHLEIYEDFDEQQLNEAAAAWIQPADGGDGGEPWVFLVDGDGTIAARWDNVLDLEELRSRLDDLPASPELAAAESGR